MIYLLKKYSIQIGVGLVALILVGGLTFAFMSGAFNEGPSKGWVTDKEYHPARDWIMIIPVHESCNMIGKTQSCIYYPQQIIPQHSDQSWELEIDDHNGNKGWRDVDPSTYDRCKIIQYCDTKE